MDSEHCGRDQVRTMAEYSLCGRCMSSHWQRILAAPAQAIRSVCKDSSVWEADFTHVTLHYPAGLAAGILVCTTLSPVFKTVEL